MCGSRKNAKIPSDWKLILWAVGIQPHHTDVQHEPWPWTALDRTATLQGASVDVRNETAKDGYAGGDSRERPAIRARGASGSTPACTAGGSRFESCLALHGCHTQHLFIFSCQDGRCVGGRPLGNRGAPTWRIDVAVASQPSKLIGLVRIRYAPPVVR